MGGGLKQLHNIDGELIAAGGGASTPWWKMPLSQDVTASWNQFALSKRLEPGPL